MLRICCMVRKKCWPRYVLGEHVDVRFHIGYMRCGDDDDDDDDDDEEDEEEEGANSDDVNS